MGQLQRPGGAAGLPAQAQGPLVALATMGAQLHRVERGASLGTELLRPGPAPLPAGLQRHAATAQWKTGARLQRQFVPGVPLVQRHRQRRGRDAPARPFRHERQPEARRPGRRDLPRAAEAPFDPERKSLALEPRARHEGHAQRAQAAVGQPPGLVTPGQPTLPGRARPESKRAGLQRPAQLQLEQIERAGVAVELAAIRQALDTVVGEAAGHHAQTHAATFARARVAGTGPGHAGQRHQPRQGQPPPGGAPWAGCARPATEGPGIPGGAQATAADHAR